MRSISVLLFVVNVSRTSIIGIQSVSYPLQALQPKCDGCRRCTYSLQLLQDSCLYAFLWW